MIKNNLLKIMPLVLVILLASGCVTRQTKQEAFPLMYEANNAHQTILVTPIINESTSSEATEYFNSTIAEPFNNKGYYILPVPITDDIFKNAGIIDGKELKGMPLAQYRDKFGADLVLFITIKKWDTHYYVVGGNVEVALEYALVSTITSQIVWSDQNDLVVDTSSSSGNLIVDLIATAITTAATDYIPIAKQVNGITTQTLPVGKYHPRYKKDGLDRVVDKDKSASAAIDFKKSL